MEYQHGRVLAYTLAKVMDSDDLRHVSGGFSNGTAKMTFKVTGHALQSPDVQYDDTVD